MSDAPEKMWVFPKKDWFDAGASTHKITVAGAKDVEYYHGDTVKARIAELEAERDAFKRRVDLWRNSWLDAGDHIDELEALSNGLCDWLEGYGADLRKEPEIYRLLGREL